MTTPEYEAWLEEQDPENTNQGGTMLLHHADRSTIHASPLRLRWYLVFIFAALLWYPILSLVFTGSAFADSDAPAPRETILSGIPVWALAVGALVPLATYVINRFTVSEPVALVVMLVVTTVAGALTQLVDAGSVGFDANTLKYVLSAVAAALLAHHWAYKPGGVNVALGKRASVAPRRHAAKPAPH